MSSGAAGRKSAGGLRRTQHADPALHQTHESSIPTRDSPVNRSDRAARCLDSAWILRRTQHREPNSTAAPSRGITRASGAIAARCRERRIQRRMIALRPGSTPAPRSSRARLPMSGNRSDRTARCARTNARLCRELSRSNDRLLTSPSRSLRARRRSSACRSVGRVGLDAVTPSRPGDHRIPYAEVADRRKRNLRVKPQRRMQPQPKPIEQRDVTRIAERLTARMDADCKLEADHREEHGCSLDRHRADEATLDPAVLRRRYSQGAGDLGPREAAVDPRVSNLGQDRRGGRATTRSPDVDPAGLRTHRGDLDRRRLPGDYERPSSLGSRGSPGSGPVAIGRPLRLQSLYEPG